MGYADNNELKNNNLYARVNKLLDSYEWSDCNFIVCGQKFQAHKLMLVITSPVFEAMFHGPLASKDKTDAIIITDIEPNAFQLLLNYIYTDKVDLNSIEDAYDLLYAAKKYLLDYLADKCISYMQSCLSMDNVVTILNYPDVVLNNEIISAATKLICRNAKVLIEHQKKDMSLSCIQKMLQSNEMNISEKDLIKFIFEWTSYYCEENDIPITLVNRRKILYESDLVKLLRFNSLTVSELNEIVDDENNVLSKKEINKLTSEIENKQSVEEDMSASNTGIRRPIILEWTLCLRSPIRWESPVVLGRNRNAFSKIKSNKTVFVKSFSIQSRNGPLMPFGDNTYCEELIVTMMCKSDHSITKLAYFKQTVKYDTSIDIDFSQPVLFKKDEWYKICFQWPKTLQTYPPTNYTISICDRSYNNGKIQFEFEDIYPATQYGSFLRGLKYCM